MVVILVVVAGVYGMKKRASGTKNFDGGFDNPAFGADSKYGHDAEMDKEGVQQLHEDSHSRNNIDGYMEFVTPDDNDEDQHYGNTESDTDVMMAGRYNDADDGDV